MGERDARGPRAITVALSAQLGTPATMPSETPIGRLAPFVPRRLLEMLGPIPKVGRAPALASLNVTAWSADISGFTELSDNLVRRGPEGVEQLSRLLDRFYSALITEVEARGGEVLKFAGDSLFAVWRHDDDVTREALDRRALLAALAGRSAFELLAREEGHPVAIRIGAATGVLSLARIGGVGGRWGLWAGGPVMTDVGSAQEQARAGVICLAPELAARLDQELLGSTLRDGYVTLKGAVREQADADADAHAPPAGVDESWRDTILAHVPAAVRHRLSTHDRPWLAEMRRLTVMFLHLGGLHELQRMDVGELHASIGLVLEHVQAHGGQLDKLSVDDKGVSTLIVFGFPPASLEFAERRAVEAAIQVRDALAARGKTPTIGMTTGDVFCGVVGGPTRQEFTVFGRTVNLAARLMQMHRQGILCDRETVAATESTIEFEWLSSPKTIRGFAEQIFIAQPVRRRPMTRPFELRIFGRDAELNFLRSRVEALAAGAGSVVVVEGEAGVGKSSLVSACVRQAFRREVRCIVSVADPIGGARPWALWRRVVRRALDLSAADQPAAVVHQQISEGLADDPWLQAVSPLLGPVIGVPWDDNELTSQLSGATRARNTERLIAALLRRAAGRQALMIVLDDVHWADSASRGLISLIASRVDQLMLLVATRPPAAGDEAWLEDVLAAPRTIHRRLEGLSPAHMRGLVAKWAGVAPVSDAVAAWIHRRARGNPFYAQEIIRSLATGLPVEREARGAALEARLIRGDGPELPHSVQAVVRHRLDDLSGDDLIVLKVASVAGPSFGLDVLRSALPADAQTLDLEGALSRLERAELVQFDAEAEHWEFAHAITRDVAYNTLLKAQVRPIHARMATALEGSLGESSRYEAVVLSHHWEQAGEPERAVVYLDLAAFHALEQGAFAETVRFLDRATRLDVPSVTAAQRGRWERALAEASFSLGDIGGAEGHARRALALLGRPLPDGQAGLVGIALRQLGRHVLGLLWRPSPETTEEGRALATLCSQSAQIVTQCAYYADAKLPLLVGGLVTLNLAEAAGHGAQLSRALGAAGIVSSSVGWGPLAKRYLARARSIAEDLDDRGALAWALFCDAMAHAAMAEWDRVADSGSRAMEVSEQLDDRQTLHHALTTLALADYFHGDLRSAETRFRRLHELATETVQTQHEAWGLYGMAECMLVRGQVEAALPRLVQAQDILATQSQRDLPSEIICSALLARAWDQLGDGDRALVAAREALSLAATSEPNAFGALEGYAVPFELLMRRWDEARRSGHPGLAARWAELETARTAMERFARQHPLGRPRHQLLLGDLAALQGDRRKASRLWARACSKARALQMRVEEGRALTRMALAVGPDDKRRARWAQAAHALFVACDARVPLRRMGVLIALTTATPALPEGAGGPGRSAGGRGA